MEAVVGVGDGVVGGDGGGEERDLFEVDSEVGEGGEGCGIYLDCYPC